MYNNYTPYGYQQYGYQQPNFFANNYQQPIQKNNYQQAITQTQDVPFNDIKFVTTDEAKAYIVMPNTKVMLMDRDKSVFYIKSADTLGKSTLEGFRYSKLEDNPTEMENSENDGKKWLTMEDIKDFLTTEDVKDFITKDDIKVIDEKLDQIQKQIRINNILKENKDI